MHLDDREVQVLEVEFELGEGVCVVDAEFVDDGTPLSESELMRLEDIYAEELYQEEYEKRADMAYEFYKDE